MLPTSPAVPVDAIVSAAIALDPISALKHTNGRLVGMCSTQVYSKCLSGGAEVSLKSVQGRYAAIYVRVSTAEQTASGYSLGDQIRRGIEYCIRKGWSFRIFSDSGLSGGLPYNSERLIARNRKRKAQTYRKSFEAVFLSDPSLTAEDRQSMEEFSASIVRQIETGQYTEEIDGKTVYPKNRKGQKSAFRPGLTVLVDSLSGIHTVCIGDLSRLSRNDQLTTALLEEFMEREINIDGIIEDLSLLRMDGIAGSVVSKILSVMAELRLGEACLGAMRGQKSLLTSGRPNGKIPSWCRRNADGYAELIPEKVRLVHRIIELFLSEDPSSNDSKFDAVAIKIAREGWPTLQDYTSDPSEFKPKKHVWQRTNISRLLKSPCLMGLQAIYGKTWKTLPAIIDEDTRQQLDQRLKAKSPGYSRKNRKDKEGYLLTSIIRCPCGRTMVRSATETGAAFRSYYRCASSFSERKNKDQDHAIFNESDINRFVNQLMESNTESIMRVFRSGDYGKTLEDEIAALHQQAEEIRREKRAAEDAARMTAEQTAAAARIATDNPKYAEWLSTTISALTSAVGEQERQILGEIDARREQLESLVPDDAIRELEKSDQSWGELPTGRKNAILRQIFKALIVCEDRIEVRLNLPVTVSLPAIPLGPRRRGSKPANRMPTVDEWLDTF
jgi:DNA invertase Pin-like site-specific DNA recombinase